MRILYICMPLSVHLNVIIKKKTFTKLMSYQHVFQNSSFSEMEIGQGFPYRILLYDKINQILSLNFAMNVVTSKSVSK